MFEIGTLDQLADITMGQSPKGSSVGKDGVIPLLNGPTEFGINYPTPVQFTSDPKRYAKKDDLLFCVRGSTGKMNWADRDYAIGRGLAAIRPKDKVSRYFLKGSIEFFLKDLVSSATGSVFSNINKDQLHKMKCFIPEKESLKSINNILRYFSEKIELDLKMNKILQDIATAIFKSWFVDFDPVKAKIEGRSTGLSKEINDLFPNSFEETNDIKIPKSWKFAKFGDLVEPKRGKVITKSKIEIGEVPVVAGGIKPPYYHSKANVKSPVVTISASGNAGYINLYYQDIWASDCSYINRDITNFIYFSHSFLKINQDKIYHLRHGAVQQHINPKDLMGLEILIPPKNLIMEYEKKVAVIHEKISNSNNEIEILLKLKNTILPKLISGKLKITYIDKEMTKERP